jgi:hypothetical protein
MSTELHRKMLHKRNGNNRKNRNNHRVLRRRANKKKQKRELSFLERAEMMWQPGPQVTYLDPTKWRGYKQ